MGDADVICLSSDDEIPTVEIPKKKARFDEELRPKVEVFNGKDIAIESRKRKFQESHKPGVVPEKISKLTTKAVIEEIVIETPSKEKELTEESEKQSKAGCSNSGAWNPFNNSNRHQFEEYNNKLVTSNSQDWKIPIENLSGDSNKIHKNPNGSLPSVADVVHDFFSKGKETKTKDSETNVITKSPSRSTNSVISSERNVESPTTIRSKIAPKNVAEETTKPRILEKIKNSISWTEISSKSNDEGEKSSESVDIEILDLETKTPNSRGSINSSSFSNETLQAESSKVSSKSVKSSGDQSPTVESSEIVIIHASPRTENSKIPIGNEAPKRSNESPEIKIIDTPKIVSNLATDKNSKSVDIPRSNGELTVINIVNESVKDIKSVPSSPKSSNSLRLESAPIDKPIVECFKVSSKVPIITSCEILTKDNPKIPKIINGTIAKPKMFSPEKTSLSKSHEESTKKSEYSAPITISRVPVVVVNRVTPKKVNESTNPKFNGSESSKLKKINESPDNSKKFDAKIANDLSEKEKVEDAKIKNVNNSKSRNSKAEANSSESSVKYRKNENTEENEPKPGCSKEPDIVGVSDIPQLIVKAKMPVHTVNQDTFAMFLGLCLTVDRDEAMEKIVAKLKRYYDDMDPAYARSREFEELLNEKRERITQAGKERVYWYTKHVMDEMKARKNKRKNTAKEGSKDEKIEKFVEERSSAKEEHEPEEHDEDSPEARRRMQNIKKIERAMKIVAKHIEKLEKAEIDLNDDDDANSNYIKLDRYQEKMIQLWNKMCEYTNEHADAGRSYLRPKYLRVTEIPSINQAINSFINSKLVSNRKKSKKRRSFIDGIIFPDYMDILECIRKVNDEQKLKLDKRTQENMAEKAFKQLGKELQMARKNDFWDTFSLNLEGRDDPAKTDNELKEKLDRNEDVNRERMSKVFEEYARKQEEAKSRNSNENATDNEDEDDNEEDDEQEEEEEDDKTSNDDIASDLELLECEDDDDETDKINDRVPNPQQTNEEKEKNKNSEEFEIIENKIETNEKNNSPNETVAASIETEKTPIVQEANENEVNLVKVDDDEEEANEAEGEKKRSLLRIRSFAKPPESWQSSQEATSSQEDSKASIKSSNNSSGKTKIIETIDVTEDDNITVVTNNSENGKRLNTLTISGKTVVVQQIDKNGNRILSKPPNVIPSSRVIMLPKNPSSKNSTSIVETPRLVSLQNSTNVRNISTVPNVIRTSKPGSPQFVRISQPPSLNSLIRMPNPSQQQIIRAPGQVLKQTPLVNAQRIRLAGQTQIRAVNPQQRAILPAVQNEQASRGVLVQLQNGIYVRTMDIRQNSENLQQRRLVTLPGNVQQLRLAVPETPRVVRVAPTSLNRSLQLRLEQTKNGILIAKTSTPKDSRGSNSRVGAVSVNNSSVQFTTTNSNIRTIVLDVEKNVSTVPATPSTPK